jgi:hypothetical protein
VPPLMVMLLLSLSRLPMPAAPECLPPPPVAVTVPPLMVMLLFMP